MFSMLKMNLIKSLGVKAFHLVIVGVSQVSLVANVLIVDVNSTNDVTMDDVTMDVNVIFILLDAVFGDRINAATVYFYSDYF